MQFNSVKNITNILFNLSSWLLTLFTYWLQANSIWLYIVPHGIRSLMNYIKQKYGNPRVIITENGNSRDFRPSASIILCRKTLNNDSVDARTLESFQKQKVENSIRWHPYLEMIHFYDIYFITNYLVIFLKHTKMIYILDTFVF